MKKNSKSKNPDGSLCSGYGVFPDGEKCKGCIDCNFKPVSFKQAIKAFNRNHAVIRVSTSKNNYEKFFNLFYEMV